MLDRSIVLLTARSRSLSAVRYSFPYRRQLEARRTRVVPGGDGQAERLPGQVQGSVYFQHESSRIDIMLTRRPDLAVCNEWLPELVFRAPGTKASDKGSRDFYDKDSLFERE